MKYRNRSHGMLLHGESIEMTFGCSGSGVWLPEEDGWKEEIRYDFQIYSQGVTTSSIILDGWVCDWEA